MVGPILFLAGLAFLAVVLLVAGLVALGWFDRALRSGIR